MAAAVTATRTSMRGGPPRTLWIRWSPTTLLTTPR
jgi:hypothetical protein